MTPTEHALMAIIILTSLAAGYLLGVIVTDWSRAHYAPAQSVPLPAPTPPITLNYL